MKPLVALFKTFRGGEWFEASLESVRSQCAGVVAVTTDQPWRGLPGTENRQLGSYSFENCREPLARFTARHPGYPVAEVRLAGRRNSDEQYTAGLAAVRKAHGPDVGVLIVDTDEVWDDASLAALRQAMADHQHALYFRAGVWSYLRSPFYRVWPQERSRVVVGLAHPGAALGDSRFSGLARIAGRDRLADVACSYHHMGYVRTDPDEITSKLDNTASQDGVPNRPQWKQEVWDHLPSGVNIHPAIGYFHHWPGLAEVSLWDLPETLTHSEAFWFLAGHHKGGIPAAALMDDAPGWRERAEADEQGIATTVSEEHVIPLCAAMDGRMSHSDCQFLVPRLRMSFRETCQLARHAAAVPAGGRVLEIGSGLGGSMAVMAAHAAEGVRLAAVDPYTPYDEENVTTSHGVGVGTVEDFNETVGRWGASRDITLFLFTSADAASSEYPGGKWYDLVLVDGNHSYSHALYDLRVWWGKLKPGGVMLLHDLSGRFPGVVRAAREFEAETGVRFTLPLMSSLAWTRKP
jgi:predicted O-methyltransferase YrrM